MFRELLYSPSGGHRLKAFSTGALNGCLRRVTIPDAVTIRFELLKMSMVLLEICTRL